MSDVPSNPVGKNKFGAYAHFPGSGPIGAQCGACAFAARYGDWPRYRWRCDKFRDLTGKRGSTIDPRTEACKYFKRWRRP